MNYNTFDDSDEKRAPRKVTDIDAVEDNITSAVVAFAQQWEPAPQFAIGVEVMGVAQLRDAMGLRASIDWGDPWPTAEKLLLNMGFRWQSLSGQRVMYLREKDGFEPDFGWEEAKEYEEEQ